MSPAGPAHAEACASIHASAFPPCEAWGALAFAALLATPNVYGLIDPAGGVMLARRAADEAEILTLATAPAIRRHGIGRGLLTEALRWAAAAGVVRVFLEVSAGNTAARALYAAAGFTVCGLRLNYYPDGSDALVLQCVTMAGDATGEAR